MSSKLEMVLNDYTEVTVINVNGKLYVKTVTAEGLEEYADCGSVHLALDEEGLINEVKYPPATNDWHPNFYYDESDPFEREV